MTVMMRIWSSLMTIVTLAHRLVIVTLAQRLMILARLEEDSDPCIVDRQWGEPDDSTSTSTGISHGIGDLTP
jgi:hypothetical protein